MKSLDTNVIIRFLVNDDKKQGDIVRSFFEKAEAAGNSYYVSIPVLLEVLWILDSVYDYSRDEIINAVESLSSMPVIIFEKADVVQEFIDAGRKARLDLSDILIGVAAKNAGCDSTLTFDLKAAKSDLFELLK